MYGTQRCQASLCRYTDVGNPPGEHLKMAQRTMQQTCTMSTQR
jgi:hypothetical protein